MRKKTRIRRTLVAHLATVWPDIADPATAIAAGRVRVNGSIVTNPASLVRMDASIVVVHPTPLRGERKLCTALADFAVEVAGRVALDAGAAAGGFTRALLAAGARRVYAVEVGYGQLLGSLRQDPRVVNLEATNIGALNRDLVPEVVELITLDLSYLSVATAVGQLKGVAIAERADLIALVKPMFELRRSTAPSDRASLDDALAHAAAGVAVAGWEVVAHADSPVRGARGAAEIFLHARYRSPAPGASIPR
jgi:23S rRNA (cytidine1920-2'-O)/16S rRNA (cytidine1409-2'-O)-methyltransferase